MGKSPHGEVLVILNLEFVIQRCSSNLHSGPCGSDSVVSHVFLFSPIGRPITGPELATLLEILVSAANEGSLAEVSITIHMQHMYSTTFKCGYCTSDSFCIW